MPAPAIGHPEVGKLSNKANLIKGSIWSVGGTVLNNLFSIIVLAVLARHLTPRDFGTVAFVSLFVEISGGIMLSGLPDALARQQTWDDRLASSAFWANVGLGLALTALTATIALVFLAPIPAALLLALSTTFLIESAGGAADARMRHEFRFRDLAARQLIGTLVGGVAAMVALYAGLGIWALVAQRLAAAASQSILLWSLVRWRPRLQFSIPTLAPVIRYSMHMMGVNALGMINYRAVDLIVGALGGPVALGMYQIAGRGLNMLVQMTILPIQRVALVAFSKLEGEEAVGNAYLRTTRIVALATFPAFLGMAAVAQDFIGILFGPQWHDASIVLILMALIVSPYTLTYFSPPALAAVGHSSALFRYNVLMTATTVVVTALAAPFGIVWVAAANAVRAHLLLPVSLGVLRRWLHVSPAKALGGLIAPGLSAAVMAAIIFLVGHFLMPDVSPTARIIVLTAMGVLVYIVLMLSFGRAAIGDAAGEMRSILPSRLRRFIATRE